MYILAYSLFLLPVSAQLGVWNLIDVPLIVCDGAPGWAKLQIFRTCDVQQGENKTEDVMLNTTSCDSAPPATGTWLVTFFRTASHSAIIDFNLTYKNALNETVVLLPNSSVTLVDSSDSGTRRLANIASNNMLANLAGAGHQLFTRVSNIFSASAQSVKERETCEVFYIAAGYSPVELPETWAESRQGFRDLCEHEGFSSEGCKEAEDDLFEGYPTGEEDLMDASPAFCQRLMNHAIAVQATALDSGTEVPPRVPPLPVANVMPVRPTLFHRRAKGWSSSNKARGAAGPTRTYGMTSTRMTQNYPRGYSQTGYGYSGARAYSPATSGRGRLAMYAGAGVVVGAVGGAYVYSRYSTYCRRGCAGYDESSDECNSDGCVRSYLPTQDMTRDDLMQTGFSPSEVSFPLTVNVHGITGVDFEKERVCPPPEWRPGSANADWWQPPADADLFFTLTEADESGFAVDSVMGSTPPSHKPGVCQLASIIITCALLARKF